MDIEIHNDKMTTIRELSPGDYYITVGHFRRYGGEGAHRTVRQRTEDPFVSRTYVGARIQSFPSERVHPVTLLRERDRDPIAKFTE